MKRLLLILPILLLLLAACSDLPEEPSPDVSLDPDEPVLTRRNITLTVWTDPGEGVEFINQAAAVFNERYPNITIRAEGVEASVLISRVWAESARGGCADLFIAPHMEIAQLAEALLILPARDQVKTKAAVYPGCAQAATAGGIMYGYPVTAETVALFYNRRLIGESEIPAAWDELAAFAKTFEEEDRRGFVMTVSSAHSAAPFISARGNRPFGPNGDNPEVMSLENVRAAEGMSVLRELGGISRLSSGDLTDAEGLFASGRAAFCIAGSWSIARFTEAGMDFGVAALPSLPGDENALPSLAFSRVMLVSAYSEHPDEASAFAALLISEEMQALRLRLTGELPSVELDLRTPHYAAGFSRQMASAYAAPSLPQAVRLWEEVTAAAAKIWDGGDVTAELAAAAAALRPPPEE
jgi:arabinogalactan oligomer/maltooligosaccharide transport system substrate-binding protein